ncbi:hypothetical protein [Enterococcus sp. LJL90]
MSFLIPFELDFNRFRSSSWFKRTLLIICLAIISGFFIVRIFSPRLQSHGGAYPFFVLHCLELVIIPLIIFFCSNQLIGKALKNQEIRLWFLQSASKSSIFLGKMLATLGIISLVYGVSFIVSLIVTLSFSGLTAVSVIKVLFVYASSFLGFLPIIPLAFLVVLLVKQAGVAFLINIIVYYSLLVLEKIELTVFKEKELRILAPSTFYSGHIFTIGQFFLIFGLTILASIVVYRLALRRFKQVEL